MKNLPLRRVFFSPYLGVICLSAVLGCAPQPPVNPYVPSNRYASNSEGRNRTDDYNVHWKSGVLQGEEMDGRARMRPATAPPVYGAANRMPDLQPVQFQAQSGDLGPGVRVARHYNQTQPPYSGPLDVGDPGVTASLWRESQAGNEPFRDFRAWQVMDLLTIVVSENSLGIHDADTEVKSKSEYLAGIEHFFGLEKQTANWTNKPDLTSLIQANTKNDFKGEGSTRRQAQLTARISAVVAEVLPSGLLRIEGEKIISVNNEEQVMVISGLVRQRDILSNNEVNASQIAQVRIDYYGKGTVGEAQYGGWLSRLLRVLWPF